MRRFYVCRVGPRAWGVQVTRGYSGNYEHTYRCYPTWRQAYDSAFSEARTWRWPEGWQP